MMKIKKLYRMYPMTFVRVVGFITAVPITHLISLAVCNIGGLAAWDTYSTPLQMGIYIVYLCFLIRANALHIKSPTKHRNVFYKVYRFVLYGMVAFSMLAIKGSI